MAKSIKINQEITFSVDTQNNEMYMRIEREGRAKIGFFLTQETLNKMLLAIYEAKDELEK